MASRENIANLNLADNIVSVCGPEKLVICMDYSLARNPDFRKVLKNFLEMKTLVNRHQIALVVFSTTEVFSLDFQTEVKLYTLNSLCDRIKYQEQTAYIDLNRIFAKVYQLAAPYKYDDVILRVIILYGRVDSVPDVESTLQLEILQREFPHFFLDILYMPQYSVRGPEKRKHVERKKSYEIFESLVKFGNQKSYIFVVENSEDLAPRVLKFLAHPALRAPLKDWWRK